MKLAVALLLVALPLSAQNWKGELIASTDLLKAGEYEKALSIDDRIVAQMVEFIGAGTAEMATFSLVLTHKAVALQGLGRTDDALWYWHEALSLHPSFATADFTPFGAPGEFLKTHPIEPLHVSLDAAAGKVKAPTLVKRVEPRYPASARALHESGAIVVESLIDTNGVIRDARVLRATDAPVLAHCALEALRQWRFHPGTQDGKPVDVIFNMTINFKLYR